MLDVIAPAGPDALWTTLLLTVILGGAAAFAAGRAIARSWRPASRLILYALMLGAAFGFLDYALFENPVISLGRLIDDLALLRSAPGAALADLLRALAGWGVNALFMLAAGGAGYALTRRRQMRDQYGAVLLDAREGG